MTFDPTSVEVTHATLPKDHCVQVPLKYIDVYRYTDHFSVWYISPPSPLRVLYMCSHLWLAFCGSDSYVKGGPMHVPNNSWHIKVTKNVKKSRGSARLCWLHTLIPTPPSDIPLDVHMYTCIDIMWCGVPRYSQLQTTDMLWAQRV